MQYLILFFPSLLLDVFAYHLFIPVLPYCADEVSIRPKFSSQKLLLYFWMGREDFSRRYTLDRLYYLLRAISLHTLHQKMHVIFVCSYFQKPYLVPTADLHTYLFEFEVYFRRKYNSPILRWTDNVIEKHRNIVALVNESAHSFSILAQQAAGNSTRRD